MLAGMWSPRIARLEALLARSDRPGGMYPPFVLASRDLPQDERAAMDESIRGSALGPAWSVWSDPARTTAERAFAVAALEPALAHVHLVVADLFLRDEDAHAEPFPEIRLALRAHRPDVWESYARLLERLEREFDKDSEMYACKRGFGYSADEATPLFTTTAELACFVRGRMAWNRWPPGDATDPELRAEIVEHELVHSAGGASAELSPEQLAALECPELLTSLRLAYHGVRAAIATLDRAPSLRSLELTTDELTNDPEEARALARLPLESLTLTLDARARVLLPAWIADLPHLRSLALRYSDAGVDRAAVDLPAALSTLDRLESLELSGVGTVPSDLGRLANLRALKIRGWSFTGLPMSVTWLTQLETLSVDPVLALPGVPDGFERLVALCSVRLGHLYTPELPRVLLRMPWLRRVELVSGRRWPAEQEAELRRALPDAYVSVGLTGNAR